MARIDMGNFGYRTPQSNPNTPTPNVDTQVADATQRLGQTAVGIGERMFYDDRQEKERAAQAGAVLAHAKIQNGMADAYDQLNADVLEGKVDKIGATARWKEVTDQVVNDNLQGVDANRASIVRAQADGIRGRFQNNLFDTFRKRDQQQVGADITAYGEESMRLGARDPNAAIGQYGTFVDRMGPAAGWSPEQIGKSKQAFKENVTFNSFRRAGQDAMQSGNPAMVEQVQQRLAGPEGDAMDPAKRNALDQTLFGWQQSMEARAERELAKADREAERRLKTASDSLEKGYQLAMNGGYLSPDYMAQLSAQAQGTGLEPQVQALFASQKEVAGFASMPPDQRAERLNAMRARRATPGVGIAPEQNEVLLRAERIDDNLRKQVDTNAWEAAQGVGVIRQAPQINITDPQAAIAVVGQRMAEIGVVEDWAGKKVSPLQPVEADQLTKLVKTLKPDAASSMLGQIGALVGDSDRVAAITKQMHDKDNTIGTAMAFASSKTTQGRYTAELVLQGAQAIKDKSIKVDGIAESGWRAQIAKQVRGAYSNQEAEDQVINAAFLIAAAKGGDVDNALNLATGGIIERNGGKIPLPYGMKEREFDKRLGAITPADLQGQAPSGFVQAGSARVPVAQFLQSIPDAQLVHAGQGRYNVRAGTTLVTNEQGRRITLQIGPTQ